MTGKYIVHTNNGFVREVFPLVFPKHLAAAIVCQAILDVLNARREMPEASKRQRLENNKKISKCVEFFYSPACDLYCDQENAGKTIMRLIDERPEYLRELVKSILGYE